METRQCSFCGNKYALGSGKVFVKKDGSTLYFCSSKCEKNMLKLRRTPMRVKWTKKGRKKG